ncbi:MAG TPA: GyrI-like domain-containing protein [Polyangiaceae bacterium]|nr:GyrI-like domain-containing protein [Polyangiaceae bacterium]
MVAVDEITDKHLKRARVRGAPSTIPGSTGMVGSYDLREVQRAVMRALSIELDKNFTVEELRESQTKLAQTAAVQELNVLEPALIALHADPMEDVPHEWTWELLLPVRGRARADEAAGIKLARVHGGMYVETVTTKGFPDLRNVYTYLLGHYLPSHKQQLTRPIIYHRALDGLESHDPEKLTLAIYIPYYLSLKSPVKLVARDEMG